MVLLTVSEIQSRVYILRTVQQFAELNHFRHIIKLSMPAGWSCQVRAMKEENRMKIFCLYLTFGKKFHNSSVVVAGYYKRLGEAVIRHDIEYIFTS